MERPKRKAINFDLDINKMKDNNVYPNGYSHLEQSFSKYGFEHRQGSGYLSEQKINNAEVYITIEKLKKENPWLSDCVKKFDVTDIGKTFDLTDTVRKNPEKTATSKKLPEGITNKLAAYQRDSILRGEIAATQTLNNILDRPAKATAKSNTSQIKKTPASAAKRTKKSKGKSKS